MPHSPGHRPDLGTEDLLSPFEVAEKEKRLEEFQRLNEAIYGPQGVGATAATEAGVNLFDPSTFGRIPGLNVPKPAPAPSPGSAEGTQPENIPSVRGREGLQQFRDVINQPPPFQSELEGLAADLRGFLTGRIGREQEAFQRFQEFVPGRVAELRGEPFTQTEEAARRVGAFDTLNRERTASKERVLEELGGLGHAPTSGIVARALQEVDRRFDALQAIGETNLLLEGTQIRDQRRAAADALEAQLAGLGFTSSGLGGELTGAFSGLGNFGLGRQGLQLGAATGFGNLMSQLFGLDLAERRFSSEDELARLQLGALLPFFSSMFR